MDSSSSTLVSQESHWHIRSSPVEDSVLLFLLHPPPPSQPPSPPDGSWVFLLQISYICLAPLEGPVLLCQIWIQVFLMPCLCFFLTILTALTSFGLVRLSLVFLQGVTFLLLLSQISEVLVLLEKFYQVAVAKGIQRVDHKPKGCWFHSMSWTVFGEDTEPHISPWGLCWQRVRDVW